MDHKGLAQTRSRSKLDLATPDGAFHGQGLTKFDQPIGFPVPWPLGQGALKV